MSSQKDRDSNLMVVAAVEEYSFRHHMPVQNKRMNRSHCIKSAFFVRFDIVILTKNNLLAEGCNVLLSYCHKTEKMFSLILLNINRIFTYFLIMRLFCMPVKDVLSLFERYGITDLLHSQRNCSEITYPICLSFSLIAPLKNQLHSPLCA